MCIICVDIEREALTLKEARRNFGEMSPTLGEHAKEVEEMLSKMEIEEMLKQFLEDLDNDQWTDRSNCWWRSWKIP